MGQNAHRPGTAVPHEDAAQVGPVAATTHISEEGRHGADQCIARRQRATNADHRRDVAIAIKTCERVEVARLDTGYTGKGVFDRLVGHDKHSARSQPQGLPADVVDDRPEMPRAPRRFGRIGSGGGDQGVLAEPPRYELHCHVRCRRLDGLEGRAG